MISVSGRYYRMLNKPASADSALLGKALGQVDEYSEEPALAAAGGIMSNVAAEGTQVHAVSGMEGTLVAADVEGSLRVFQRVSFNGKALKGQEKLEDTLKLKGHIRSMTLSGTGTVSDAGACEQLFGTLLAAASYEGSGSLTGRQTLHIELDNGLTVQLMIRDDKLAACGVWSCPEFMEAFAAAVQ